MGCELCPRRCGAERKTEAGVCRCTETLRIARAAAHYGEEPCISGAWGAGAVFFSGCPLGCVYCQNYRLSRGMEGREITTERLAEIFTELAHEGVQCLDLVTGTQYVPQILRALELAKPTLPVVWNSSGYERTETIRALAKYVKCWMPDMKYALRAPAARYSRAPDYPEVAKAAILEMFRQSGPYRLDEDGVLVSGVVIRHLVLPGQLENTRRVIEWVGETFDEGDVLFSLMAQYTPCGEAERYPELSRPLTQSEWDEALACLDASPISDGYVQELSASGTEEIPAFDGTGV